MTEYNREPWPEEEVEVAVEKIEKFGEEPGDNKFFTELRVLTGPQKGELKRALWFRNTLSGSPSKPTTNLFMALTGNPEAPSYDLLNKMFKTKPWYLDGKTFPVFTGIEKTGEVDPFA